MQRISYISKHFTHFRFQKFQPLTLSITKSGHGVAHLADKVMVMSAPSILSAFWTFSMMGLLTWEISINHKSYTRKTEREMKMN